MRLRTPAASFIILLSVLQLQRSFGFLLQQAQIITPAASTSSRLYYDATTQSNQNNKLFETSQRHIHVGNLDWNRSVDAVSRELSQAVTATRCIGIELKPINSNRPRDRDKRHGGSAVIEFVSTQQASQGLKALKIYSDQNGSNYRLKYAVLVKAQDHENVVVTKEQLQRRRERTASYGRRRRRVAERTDQIVAKLLTSPMMQTHIPVLQAPLLDWSKCPVDVGETDGGGLVEGSDRAQRKRAAVEAYLPIVQEFVSACHHHGTTREKKSKNVLVADMGCGTGNLALPLQWWLERQQQQRHGKNSYNYNMVCVDRNPKSLERLEHRAARANLSVHALEEDLMHLINTADDDANNQLLSGCNLVVSLHACGAASDMAMAAAIARSIPFAISPCCIGKVNSWYSSSSSAMMGTGMPSPLHDLSYPRSKWLQGAIQLEEYELLAKAADYGVVYGDKATDAELQRRDRCRLAKRIVEMDRLRWAEEHGYEIGMVELPRIGPLYPKRELLLGAPKDSSAAVKLKKLQAR
ncbi:S-transferase C-terminal domain-containing protein [Seminavis robusta]|uniref:S-transferase C-terminal domain-containing protein n=1 Tax=Seminavis robusta TaxID=568900 RepID=A0A9N8EBX0_9STRA|nr:S-transferase C-terminal domain-containing protein [Seminavis robusta]|eukprot:Sro782_g201790.1 S-transferase C-terminal domain-containing protein (524) ;mRNA; r:32975-34546